MRMNHRKILAGMSLGLLIVSSGVAAQSHSSRAQSGGVVTFRVGERVPDSMLADDNVIKNYSHYHLNKPQDGYEWIHGDEANALLVSTKSMLVRKIEYRPNIRAETK